ncbi:MAG: hypothetical protein LBM02_09725 [Lachnospiraceae bacterium]|jgi:hypothetical protein|nr:hypothetical protein [Lachnospiraceae bacterium]
MKAIKFPAGFTADDFGNLRKSKNAVSMKITKIRQSKKRVAKLQHRNEAAYELNIKNSRLWENSQFSAQKESARTAGKRAKKRK